MIRRQICLLMLLFACGCTTMKESDTSRTGVEQLLISSATDRALDKVDLKPIAGAKVFVEPKYLECVDKNYVLVSIRQRLLEHRCALVEKADEAEVILEVGSGGVGTDRTEMFVGIPEIPLPPPSPISLPKISMLSRTKSMGTAKLVVVAYEAKTKVPLINSGYALARADHQNWNVMGVGGIQRGMIPKELETATGETESIGTLPSALMAGRPTKQPGSVRQAALDPADSTLRKF